MMMYTLNLACGTLKWAQDVHKKKKKLMNCREEKKCEQKKMLARRRTVLPI